MTQQQNMRSSPSCLVCWLTGPKTRVKAQLENYNLKQIISASHNRQYLFIINKLQPNTIPFFEYKYIYMSYYLKLVFFPSYFLPFRIFQGSGGMFPPVGNPTSSTAPSRLVSPDRGRLDKEEECRHVLSIELSGVVDC